MELDLPPEASLRMPRAPRSLRAAVIAYFLAMAGLSLCAVQLLAVVTAQVIALSLPLVLGASPSPTSRIEQRRIEMAQAVPPMPVAKLAALHEPAGPTGVLAAELDIAETESLMAAVATESSIAESKLPELRVVRGGGRTKPRLGRLAARFATPPAADAFNRNFGVLPVASN